MSEAGLHPLEMILRLCASVAPEPWYPRLFAKQESVDRQALGQCLEELWLDGLIERAAGTEETGPAITLTREGQRVLLDPEALERLRAGEPASSTDRGAIIRGALASRMRPIVTVALVLINVLVFAWGYLDARAMNVGNDFLRGAVVAKGPVTAEERTSWNEVHRIQEQSGTVSAYNLIDGQWWRLLTAGFVHIGFPHLLMNMVVLYLAGRFIEQMWGHVRYLMIYLSAVLGGCCLAVAHNVAAVAGASGAVCGLLGAEAVWFFFNQSYLPRAVSRRARTIFLLNLVLLIFISSFKNVSAWGHFGGGAAGALTAMLLQLHRFGPPVWRWLAMIGFVPLAWYGDYVLQHARATDPGWHEAERRVLQGHFRGPVARVLGETVNVYRRGALPILAEPPALRDASKIEKVLDELAQQRDKLDALDDALVVFGPLVGAEAEKERQRYRDWIANQLASIDAVEEALRNGGSWPPG